ncbi:hypothetical protein [Rouxiella sp. Mn2063]|uniref:hypothetical protein n=1 Tax=Rouxiella sp. Mn2063 TaxID=3395262 RepID=UPI003BCA6463
MTVISINQAKQQRERDEAELRRMREWAEQLYRTLEVVNERERELVNRLGTNKPTGPEVA